MLKHLFTSNTRVKLLTLFLKNPDEEYFVRELTRNLDEQINSIRRELDNLKKMGFLKSRAKNRRKFYTVNKQFLLFRDLQNIFLKAGADHEKLVKAIQKLGKVEFLMLAGQFLQKEDAIDLLVVGSVDAKELEALLDKQEVKNIKFSLLSAEDFEYRVKYQDPVLFKLISDGDNLILVNRLLKEEE